MRDLPVLDPDAAFVDGGGEQRRGSIAGGPAEVFGQVTAPLHALRDGLLAQGVRLGGDGSYGGLLAAPV